MTAQLTTFWLGGLTQDLPDTLTGCLSIDMSAANPTIRSATPACGTLGIVDGTYDPEVDAAYLRLIPIETCPRVMGAGHVPLPTQGYV